MARKPKTAWQIAVRAELDKRGMGYKELAEEMQEKEGNIRQIMSKDNQPLLRERIIKYLGMREIIATSDDEASKGVGQ